MDEYEIIWFCNVVLSFGWCHYRKATDISSVLRGPISPDAYYELMPRSASFFNRKLTLIVFSDAKTEGNQFLADCTKRTSLRHWIVCLNKNPVFLVFSCFFFTFFCLQFSLSGLVQPVRVIDWSFAEISSSSLENFAKTTHQIFNCGFGCGVAWFAKFSIQEQQSKQSPSGASDVMHYALSYNSR